MPGDVCSPQVDPYAAPGAFERGRRETHVPQAVFEGRERHRRGLAVERGVRRRDEVAPPLVEPSRPRRELARRGRSEVAVPRDDGLAADRSGQPELVFPREAPGRRRLRAVDRELEIVPVTRGRLGDDARPLEIAHEAHEERRVVFGRAAVQAADLGDHGFDPPPADPLGEVEPMDADVGDRARHAAARGIEAPVRVPLEQQPVLEVGAAHQVRPAELPRGHASGELRDQRQEAVVLADDGEDAGGARQVGELVGAGNVERQRLLADDLLCPPYDVIPEELRTELYARSPYNFVRVEYARDEPSADRYAVAARSLAEWTAAGTLRRDAKPAFYGYDHVFVVDGAKQLRRGFFCALKLHGLDEGVVVPHELTFPKAKADRLELLRRTRTNTSAVFATYADDDGAIAALLARARKHAVGDARQAEERHTIWTLDDDRAANELRDRLKNARLYIADGHHRYETAPAYRAEDKSEGARFGLAYLCPLTAPGRRTL